jgi:anti-sigma-K factor RskA
MSSEQERLDDLLAAYALDAVSADERREVEQYLQINPRARREVEEHREVATMLAWSGAAAPEGLWDRIAANLDASAPRPSGELASVLAFDGGRDRRNRRRNVGQWAMVSAAAAVVAVVAVATLTRDETPPPLAAAVAAARDDRDSITYQLVREDGAAGVEAIIDQDGHGYLLGAALPALGTEQTYQLWGVIDGQVISLGVLGRNPEIEPFSAGAAVSQLVVTVEPAGGVVSNGNPDGAFASATI